MNTSHLYKCLKSMCRYPFPQSNCCLLLHTYNQNRAFLFELQPVKRETTLAWSSKWPGPCLPHATLGNNSKQLLVMIVTGYFWMGRAKAMACSLYLVLSLLENAEINTCRFKAVLRARWRLLDFITRRRQYLAACVSALGRDVVEASADWSNQDPPNQDRTN